MVHNYAIYCLTALLAAAPARADNSGGSLLEHRPRVPPSPVWRAPTPIVSTTADGIRVMTVPARELPLVSILVLVAAGSALDPPEQPGLASATALGVEQGGAGAMSGTQVAEAVDALGGELKVECDRVGVRIALTVQSSRLGAALDLLGAMVAKARLDGGEWSRARSRRVAEILRARDEPRKIADAVFERAIYGDHPYAHPPLGTKAAVEAMGVEALKAFYAQHWGPRATQVVLAGDLAPEEAPRLVEHAFAGWGSKAAPAPAPAAPAPLVQQRVILVDRPGAPQSALQIGHLGVPASTPDFPSLAVSEMVLGGSFTSRLVQNLRERHGYTYGVRAKFELWRAPGPFVVMTAVRTDATAPAIHEAMGELGRIRAPLGRAELAKGRALVEGGIVEAMTRRRDTAALYGELAAADRPLDLLTKLPDALAALTPAKVAQASKRLYRPDAATLVVVGDRKQVEEAVSALKLGTPRGAIEHQDPDGNPLDKR